MISKSYANRDRNELVVESVVLNVWSADPDFEDGEIVVELSVTHGDDGQELLSRDR